MKSVKYIGFNKDFFYFAAVVSYLIETVLSKSFFKVSLPDIGFKLFTLICLICLMLFKCMDLVTVRYKKKALIGIIVTYFFLFFFYLHLGMKVALFLVFIVFGRNIRFERTANVIMYTLLFMLAIVVLSSKAGIIMNYSVIERGKEREYLGFLYMLYPMSLMASITFLYVYLNKRNLSVPWLAVIGLVNFYLFSKTDARLSFMCSMAAILIALIMRRYPGVLPKLGKHKVLMLPMCFIYVGASLGSIIVIKAYNPKNVAMRTINEFLENRLELSIKSIQLYGVNLFGQSIEWIGNGFGADGKLLQGEYLYVDNFYLNYLQRLGILPFIFLITMITLTLLKANKNHDYLLLLLCSIEAIHGLLDDGVFSMRYFPFWLLLGNYLFSGITSGDALLNKLEEMLNFALCGRMKFIKSRRKLPTGWKVNIKGE